MHDDQRHVASIEARIASAALFFLTALVVCLRQAPLERPFSADNELYYYVSERVASGVPPHVSLIDHKNALSSMLSGAAIAAGRTVGIDDVVSARSLSIVVAAATVASVWLLALALSGSLVGAHASGLVMLTFDQFLAQGAQGVRPKVFMELFMVLALLAFAHRRLIAAGFCAALSYLCWQPALLMLASLSAAALPGSERRRSWTRLGVGAGVALLAYEAYFLWYGALGEQLRQSYLMATNVSGYKFPGFADGLHFILQIGRRRATSIPVVSSVFVSSLVAVWVWALLKPRVAARSLVANRGFLAALLAAYATVAFTFIDHQAYPDRFFVEPYAALAFGLVVAGLARHVVVAPRRWLTPVSAALTIVLVVVVAADGRRAAAASRRNGLAAQRQLADEVAVLAREYGSVWVIGSVHLLGLAHLTNYSPVGLFIDPRVRAYLHCDEQGAEYRPPTSAGDEPPVVIVASRVAEAARMRWIPRDYRRLDIGAFQAANTRVWLRRDRRENAVTQHWPAPTICGDPIGDRSVHGLERPITATDALALLRAAAGSQRCAACICDLDGNGRVSASDALRLLRVALGADLAIHCPPCPKPPSDVASQ